jgi:parallel beta-helix repeat protein
MAVDVTIDLNGFSIIGPAVCLGRPPVCTGGGSGVGVFSARDNITILNGKIRGMSGGISLSGVASRVERVHAVGNAGSGISVPSSSGNSVIECTAHGNAGAGIEVDGLAQGNIAFGNAGNGIFVIGSAINNNSQNNLQSGISGSGTFLGNTARFNGTQGIFASCRSTIVSNTADGNLGGDIFTSGANCVLANNAFKP